MKRGILYSVIFVLVFSVSLLAHLPISFVLQHMPSVRGLKIEGAQGTVWQGRADQVSWQKRNYGAAKWDFQLSQLFQAKAEFAVRFGRGSDIGLHGKGMVGYGLSGPYAESVVASMPAEQALALSPMPIPVPVTLNGQLELTIKQMTYASPWCQAGEGSLAWSSSSVESPIGSLDLGPVIADFTCADSKISAKGGQQSSNVSSEFTGELTPNRRYSSQAWFKPGSEFPAAMKSQLKWLGNPDGQGKYQFNYQGRF
ncbi:type II secretion system protein N [Vibrio cortegadensis]|uniref:type II secretion system protein N n=1 Tax=Vibrio cortegadensis TaxID=1328770 RepID=UPI0021C49B07|nr:type II secretion system protein N [Vibrio cortegadensis]MDN3697649.1 type II secretion system protein N [Vibrio cortegadensis]